MGNEESTQVIDGYNVQGDYVIQGGRTGKIIWKDCDGGLCMRGWKWNQEDPCTVCKGRGKLIKRIDWEK